MHIDHINIIVDDMPAMVAFYQNVLRLRRTKQAQIAGDWIETLTGFENVEADVSYLEGDGETGIELICYRTPAGLCGADRSAANTKGIRHIAFRVDDLDETVADMKAAGVRFLSDVQTVSAAQVDYTGQQKQIVYCLDPEDNLIELCEFQSADDLV